MVTGDVELGCHHSATGFGWFVSEYADNTAAVGCAARAPAGAIGADANDSDPRMSTRTVIAPAWQRWLLAPHGVNFHLEHHLLPGVPCYHLPAFRARLVEMGWLDRVPVFSGYHEVFAHAVRRG